MTSCAVRVTRVSGRSPARTPQLVSPAASSTAPAPTTSSSSSSRCRVWSTSSIDSPVTTVMVSPGIWICRAVTRSRRSPLVMVRTWVGSASTSARCRSDRFSWDSEAMLAVTLTTALPSES